MAPAGADGAHGGVVRAVTQDVQIRYLESIKKHLEDKQLRLDDQVAIRECAVRYWFNTNDCSPFVVLDSRLGQPLRGQVMYENYPQPHNHHHHSAEGERGAAGGAHRQQGTAAAHRV